MSEHDHNFEGCYKRYYPKVFYFFVYKGISKEDAKDLAHDAFLRIYRHWQEFRGETSLSKWVEIVAKSVWYNYIRAHKTQKREAVVLSLDHGATTMETENGNQPHPEKAAIRNEHLTLLRQAIFDLPERTRAAVILRIYQGLQYSEIARLLGVSEETVKSQCSQAKKRLGKALAKHFDNVLI